MLARTLSKCVRPHANPAQTLAWLSRVAGAVPELLSTIPPVCAGKIKFRFLSHLPVGSGFLLLAFWFFACEKYPCFYNDISFKLGSLTAART